MAEALRIIGFGNPLLDISAVVGDEELTKWGAEMGNAILADDKHKPLYAELAKAYPVEYIAGGATQNSIRVAQWMYERQGGTAYVGCIGEDEFGAQLESAAKADGVNVCYMKQNKEPTGTCAVLVKDNERSLIANLAAANCYDKAHFETEQIQALVTAAKIVYCAGFFLTVSPPTMVALGEHVAATGKTFCLNLSAPFIIQFFKDPLAQVMPFVDFLFANESEAAAYGKENGLGEDLSAVALAIAKMPKASGTRPRVVVFTQGKDPTLVACGGVVSSYEVPLLEKEKLIDTNGAGDAFVGGFLALLAKGGDLVECVEAGHWGARQIIQQSGCKIPAGPCSYVR
jgi:adenosine kinase